MAKKILCLDFDGVCHSYTSGWQGADVIPDPPVPGLFEFLERAKDHFDIQIFSSRSNQAGGISAMEVWFGKYWSEYILEAHPELRDEYENFEFCPEWISFPQEKPPAFISIDDRAVQFTGRWPEIEELTEFQPWYKEKKTDCVLPNHVIVPTFTYRHLVPLYGVVSFGPPKPLSNEYRVVAVYGNPMRLLSGNCVVSYLGVEVEVL